MKSVVKILLGKTTFVEIAVQSMQKEALKQSRFAASLKVRSDEFSDFKVTRAEIDEETMIHVNVIGGLTLFVAQFLISFTVLSLRSLWLDLADFE